MRRLVLFVVAGLALACGGVGAPPTGPAADAAKQFATIDCSPGSSDVDRAWCPVAAAGSGPFTPSPTTRIRLGLTLAVKDGQDPKTAVEANTTLSALYVGASGAKLLDIKPSNDAEMQSLVGVVMSVAATLKGVADSSVLASPDLLDYLKSQSGDLHTLTVDENGASFQGTSDPAVIERVEGAPWGAAYVVVETTGDGGRFVSVFPDSDPRPLPK